MGRKVIDRLLDYLEKGSIRQAIQLYDMRYNSLNRSDRNEYRLAKDQVINKMYRELFANVKNGNFDDADQIFTEIEGSLNDRALSQLIHLDYLSRDLKPKDKKTRELSTATKIFWKKIEHLLKTQNFLEADDLYFANTQGIMRTAYEQVKSVYMKTFLNSIDHPLKDDIEKARALAAVSKNIQIKARAGSGKTTTIACKTALLCSKYNVNPSNIMILTFNKQAAFEIGSRLREKYGYGSFNNARTFHSLAWQIVKPENNILSDSEGEESSSNKQTSFLSQCFQTSLTPLTKERLYEFFRHEVDELDSLASSLSDAGYEHLKHKIKQLTLRGELVKSRGEKYIADFLFEHGISYDYEPFFRWEGRAYRPDFTFKVNGQAFALEHWGVDEANPHRSVPAHWTKTFDEYIGEMQRKRAFWRDEKPNYILLETSLPELDGSREVFERCLRVKLEAVGVVCEKINKAELVEKVVILKGNIKPQLLQLFLQFINRAKQQGWSSITTIEKIRDYQPRLKREQIFLEIAQIVYAEYEKRAQELNALDFNDLLRLATHKIERGEGDCTVGAEPNGIAIRDLEWLLIDEFQDFSKLFSNLVDAMQKIAPKLRLFVVGDDWQSINGFAGSETTFFKDFTKLYKSSDAVLLRTNYRSRPKIVKMSNAFMREQNEQANFVPSNYEGDIFIEHVDKIWLNKMDNNDKQFMSNDYDFSDQARYMKLCFNLAIKHFSKDSATELIIIARTNYIAKGKLKEFERKLKNCLSRELFLRRIHVDLDLQVRVSTVHKAKGLEADVVIILQVTDYIFPLMHPNNELGGLFGQTTTASYMEETRLFYVALTRPRNILYLLTETGRESEFLKQL